MDDKDLNLKLIAWKIANLAADLKDHEINGKQFEEESLKLLKLNEKQHEDRCVSCGKLRSEHNVRHPFVSNK